MSTILQTQERPEADDCTVPPEPPSRPIGDVISESWTTIAPFWPLENLIAVNPLRGFEHLPIEAALTRAEALFEQADLPGPMLSVNRESIKWLQAFFDDGQATIAMPLRNDGLFAAWKRLAAYDPRLTGNDAERRRWLRQLPDDSETAIVRCLDLLRVPSAEQARFLGLLLATLSGWAAHVQYRTSWTADPSLHRGPVSQADFLALRIAICCLLWPEAKALLEWHDAAAETASAASAKLAAMEQAEMPYRRALLDALQAQSLPAASTPAAQLVFCIDVRSEPFRRALEQTGDYQTFGFAGFFGVPVAIEDSVTGERHASCPVLLNPRHNVREAPQCSDQACRQDRLGHKRLAGFKRLYQSVKYTFTTPFMLVETMGIASGAWMALRSLAPRLAEALQSGAAQAIRPALPRAPEIDAIGLDDQCAYAEGALKTMGLTSHFAPLIVLCGHGSTTRNNAYASALDCGACGGRHGAPNARILAAILNRPEVRATLVSRGLDIPAATRFVAAEHDTTNDRVELFADAGTPGLAALKADLERARRRNSAWRCAQLQVACQSEDRAAAATLLRSTDWAQVRPEWGLAGNAAFIVAPRGLSRALDLSGRCFLHSYDHEQDPAGAALETILTAPMVVAQWINNQYLFSALDNVAYGGGSKITKNITGKIGIMQGNASDLMTGLPLQSVNLGDKAPYHEPQRLMCVVYAPRAMIDPVIARNHILQTLFGNGWVCLACIEPQSRQTYCLTRDLRWVPAS